MKKALIDIRMPWYQREIPSLNDFKEYYKDYRITEEGIKALYKNNVRKFFGKYSNISNLGQKEKNNYVELLKEKIEIKDFENYKVQSIEDYLKENTNIEYEIAKDELYKKIRNLWFYLIQNNF